MVKRRVSDSPISQTKGKEDNATTPNRGKYRRIRKVPKRDKKTNKNKEKKSMNEGNRKRPPKTRLPRILQGNYF